MASSPGNASRFAIMGKPHEPLQALGDIYLGLPVSDKTMPQAGAWRSQALTTLDLPPRFGRCKVAGR